MIKNCNECGALVDGCYRAPSLPCSNASACDHAEVRLRAQAKDTLLAECLPFCHKDLADRIRAVLA